jgi:hypothetical protein
MSAIAGGWLRPAGDPVSDCVDRGPVDDGHGEGGVAFVVPGQAAVRGQSGGGALDGPVAREHGEDALIGGFAATAPPKSWATT